MMEAEIDQLAAVKASLELMIIETEEIHEYFSDLVEKLDELEALEPDERRGKFQTLVEMGAFKFNGLDIRRFSRAQTSGPLSPPLFFSRTRRRLKNTTLMVEEFRKRELFSEADRLLDEIEMLSSTIVNENDHQEVMSFKENVEALRDSDDFQKYVKARNSFVHKDTDLKTDTELIAAKETVEEGEEMLQQRGEELTGLSEQLESGKSSVEDIGNVLDKMSFDKT
ncbi:MAG: hypothetical protein IIC13_16000 [SAR324 cluster bacterium]|nr:hypothetical protein [SAR324 cluster bacterium]